jgi:squalene-hopene/tetraprenyl-beta-curcumene cyclase
MKPLWRAGVVLSAALLAPLGLTRGGEKDLGPDPKEVQAVLEKATAFLKTQQEASGGFSSKRAGPGVTALVAAGLLRNGVGTKDPVVARALASLEKQAQKDGGIYDKFLANYTTSVAIMAFKEANTDGRYDTLLENAAGFLKGLQQGGDPRDLKHGGFGYDGKSRPDLSNSNFTVEALLAAGVPKNDPAIQKALKFISRCQNLAGEFNDQEFARKATKDDEGGFVYNPLDPDDKRHKTPEGGLRSTGAMTYGGLKSFLYAGVSKEDKRVQAAVKWIRNHYTLKENPGMGQAGLYYYYHTFGKAMAALGEDRFEAGGKKHDWRRELFEALRERQQANGSWSNTGDRTFGEADPNIATAFAILTLSYCKAPRK